MVGAGIVNVPVTIIMVAKTICVSPIADFAGNVRLVKVKFCSVIVVKLLEKTKL